MSKTLSGLEKKIAGKADFEAYEKHIDPEHQEILYNEIEEVLYGVPGRLDKNPGAANRGYQALHRITGDPKKDEIKNKKHAEQIVAEYAREFLKKVKPGVVEKIDGIEDEKKRLETLLTEFDYHSGLSFGNQTSGSKTSRQLIDDIAKDKKAKKYIRHLNDLIKKHYIPNLNLRYHQKYIPETARLEYADYLKTKLRRSDGVKEEFKGAWLALGHDKLRQMHHMAIKDKGELKKLGLTIEEKKKK